MRPQSAIVAPTAIAAFGPTTRARVAVFKTTIARSSVKMVSTTNALDQVTGERGAPRWATLPKIAHKTPAAATAPAHCINQYAGTHHQRNTPRIANASVTTGLTCAPETSPIE